MTKRFPAWLAIALAACLAAACRAPAAPNRLSYEYIAFSGVKTTELHASAGQTIGLRYDVKVDKGHLTLLLVGPDREIAWGKEFDASARDDLEITATSDGAYTVVVEGIATAGSFDISWSVK